jgi:TetR/AcrR family transcriptional regulator
MSLSTSMRRRPRKVRQLGEQTEARILEAAQEVFGRFGYEGARMDQIAERAGVQKANIYYYFDGKQELYQALMNQILGDVLSEVSRFLTLPADSPWAQLDAFLDVFFNLVERYRGMLTLAFGELLHPPREQAVPSPIMPMLDQIETVAKQLIADGIAKGMFRKQDPAQVIITLEGAIFHYFLLPEERLASLVSESKFSRSSLDMRKEALRDHIRRILAD